jgi:hypothetical protein
VFLDEAQKRFAGKVLAGHCKNGIVTERTTFFGRHLDWDTLKSNATWRSLKKKIS